MKSCQQMHFLFLSISPTQTNLLVFQSLMLTMYMLSGFYSVLSLLAMFLIFIGLLFYLKELNSENNNGEHLQTASEAFKLGFLAFIFSEIMLFVSFFWAFFHSNFVPVNEVGLMWLLKQNHMNPLGVPFLNTIILLSSGVVVTVGHHFVLKNKSPSIFIFFTVLLGIIFSGLQLMEYKSSVFSISEGVQSSLFFMLTGFHGAHVFVGTCGLILSLMFSQKLRLTNLNILSFEMVLIYWHFVDVVWIFLFLFLYCLFV